MKNPRKPLRFDRHYQIRMCMLFWTTWQFLAIFNVRYFSRWFSKIITVWF